MSAAPPDPVSAVPPDPATLDRPWVGSYPPGVPPTYRLPEVATPRFLDDAARDFPNNDAIVAAGTVVDHAGLRERVHRLAAALAGAGVGAGDRVLVGVPNGHAAPVVMFALWRIGAVVVPIDPETREDRIAEVAADADVVGVVGTGPVLDALVAHVALPVVAVLVDGSEWPAPGRGRRIRGLLALPRLRPSHRATDGPDVAALTDLLDTDRRDLPSGPTPDDPALIAYRPHGGGLRGVVLTQRNLVASAFQTRLWIPDVQAGRERVLVADGLHSVSALTMGLLTGLLSGGAVILLDDPGPADLARSVEREAPTLFPTLASRLRDLVSDDAVRRDLTSLRVVMTVGGPIAAEVGAELERRTGGARVREGYGLAEAGPLTHAQPVYGRVTPGTMGLPVTSTVAAVVERDDPGVLCAVGEPGLLVVSGPQVACGYWRQEGSGTFVGDWVVTDDLAVVDDDGVFRHVARAAEVIERHGELVSPRQVEAVLERHPDVRHAGVVADEEADLLVAAVVPRRRRPKPEPEELLVYCRAHLDSPAVPDRVILVDELPHNEAGELARDELRRDLVGR